MAIPDGHKHNFEMLKRAFAAGDVALAECTDKKTGGPVYVVCAVGRDQGDYVLTPFAKLFDADPYGELEPPT